MVYLYGRPHSPSNVACQIPSLRTTLQSRRASAFFVGASPGCGWWGPHVPVQSPVTSATATSRVGPPAPIRPREAARTHKAKRNALREITLGTPSSERTANYHGAFLFCGVTSSAARRNASGWQLIADNV